MRPVYGLSAFIPVALVLDLTGASPTLVFATSAVGIVPTAALMGEATEHLAALTGPGIGGLVNVTFGNAPELIIAVFALADGLQEVVKACWSARSWATPCSCSVRRCSPAAGGARDSPSIGPQRRHRPGCCC